MAEANLAGSHPVSGISERAVVSLMLLSSPCVHGQRDINEIIYSLSEFLPRGSPMVRVHGEPQVQPGQGSSEGSWFCPRLISLRLALKGKVWKASIGL